MLSVEFLNAKKNGVLLCKIPMNCKQNSVLFRIKENALSLPKNSG